MQTVYLLIWSLPHAYKWTLHGRNVGMNSHIRGFHTVETGFHIYKPAGIESMQPLHLERILVQLFLFIVVILKRIRIADQEQWLQSLLLCTLFTVSDFHFYISECSSALCCSQTVNRAELVTSVKHFVFHQLKRAYLQDKGIPCSAMKPYIKSMVPEMREWIRMSLPTSTNSLTV